MIGHEKRQQEVALTNQLIEQISGSSASFLRPPYGDTTRELTEELADTGITSVLWNVDSWDWGDPVPESIVQRVVERVEKAERGILLFHDVHKQTLAALPDILGGPDHEAEPMGHRFSPPASSAYPSLLLMRFK